MTLQATLPGADQRTRYDGRCDVIGCPWHVEARQPALIVEFYGNHFESSHRGAKGALRIAPVPPWIPAGDLPTPGDDHMLIPWPPEVRRLAELKLMESPAATIARVGRRDRTLGLAAILLPAAMLAVAMILVADRQWQVFSPQGGAEIALAWLAVVLVLAAPGTFRLIRPNAIARYQRTRLAALIIATVLAVLSAVFFTFGTIGVADMSVAGQLSAWFVDWWCLEWLLSYACVVALGAAVAALNVQTRRLAGS